MNGKPGMAPWGGIRNRINEAEGEALELLLAARLAAFGLPRLAEFGLLSAEAGLAEPALLALESLVVLVSVSLVFVPLDVDVSGIICEGYSSY